MSDRKLWVWQYDEESEGQFIYEPMEEIRFRVRTVNFTKVVTNAKGMQATTTSETKAESGQPSAQIMNLNPLHKTSGMNVSENKDEMPMSIRRRSSSIGLLDDDEMPSAMQIIGCVNEDGLGPIS
eukprot:CAMPEP_0182417462 /NCGR_PEP_ID=MMETSP1167-20130531/1955_1 /TAXON_ID=2988 /ORGANISM="Mallomonas Sp, Strain CCMP3275" /LENGTH=124 /DNA_ID=CAMNT_0024591069 /DNA_START=492 /DNA_END=862 /DNA_ORIENTATION=-